MQSMTLSRYNSPRGIGHALIKVIHGMTPSRHHSPRKIGQAWLDCVDGGRSNQEVKNTSVIRKEHELAKRILA